jgi:hypothetical protein
MLLSKAICDIFSNVYLAGELVFRGGTALNKLIGPLLFMGIYLSFLKYTIQYKSRLPPALFRILYGNAGGFFRFFS